MFDVCFRLGNKYSSTIQAKATDSGSDIVHISHSRTEVLEFYLICASVLSQKGRCINSLPLYEAF